MNVEAFGKGLLQRLDIGDMRQETKLDLAVVGGDEKVALLRDEGRADLAPILCANRNVLEVRFGGSKAAG